MEIGLKPHYADLKRGRYTTILAKAASFVLKSYFIQLKWQLIGVKEESHLFTGIFIYEKLSCLDAFFLQCLEFGIDVDDTKA